MSNSSMTTGVGNASPPPSTGGVKAHMLWHAIRRHPISVLVLLLLSVAAAAAVWLFLPLPKLTGVAVFHVAAQPPAVVAPTFENKAEFTTYKTMQAAVVKQRLVLSKTLNELQNMDAPTLKREADQTGYLEQHLNVDFKAGPELMRVTIEGDNGDELLNVLSAVSTAYLAEVRRMERGARDTRKKELEVLRKRHDDLLTGYRAKLTQLADTLSSASPVVIAVLDEIAVRELKELQLEIGRNKLSLKEATERFEFYRKEADKADQVAISDAEIDRAVDQAEGVRRREQEITEKQRAVVELDKDLADKAHPSLLAAKKRLEDAKADLAKYREELRPQVVKSVRQKLTQESAALAAKNAERANELSREKVRLEEAVNAVKREIGAKGLAAVELEKVREEIARTVSLRDQIAVELSRLEVEAGAPLRVTQYGDGPYLVTGIEGNRRLKAALMATAGTLLVGLVGLVFWESRNRRILAVDDLGQGLGLKVFGTVPPVGPAAGGLAGQEAAVAEAIDTARTMLLYGTYGEAPRTVLVTSALPGEGKTSLTGHLAISLARAGYRTLLIDGDLRNPANHRIFEVPIGPGLSELLRGESDLAEAVQPTPFPNLSVLPAGRWTLAATQALAGDRWAAVRAGAQAGYDFVVIDSAPVLPVVDSLLLARHVDGVLLSVLHDHSRVASVAESRHRLLSIGANLLGVVLNGIEPRGGQYGYAAYGYSGRSADPAVATTA